MYSYTWLLHASSFLYLSSFYCFLSQYLSHVPSNFLFYTFLHHPPSLPLSRLLSTTFNQVTLFMLSCPFLTKQPRLLHNQNFIKSIIFIWFVLLLIKLDKRFGMCWMHRWSWKSNVRGKNVKLCWLSTSRHFLHKLVRKSFIWAPSVMFSFFADFFRYPNMRKCYKVPIFFSPFFVLPFFLSN